MAFTPLTREQYQKQIDAGFTPDKILEFEKRRKSESEAKTPSGGFFASQPSTQDPYKTGSGLTSPVLPYSGQGGIGADLKQAYENPIGAVGNLITGAGKAIANAPTSIVRNVEALASPKTYVQLGRAAAGAISEIPGVRQLYDKLSTTKGQDILAGNRQTFDSFVQGLKNSYGSYENIKRSLVEDPAGAYLIGEGVLKGGGELLSKAPGKAGELGTRLSKTADAISPAGIKSASQDLYKAITSSKPENIDAFITKNFEKGIRPSVVGKTNTPGQYGAYMDKAVSVVKDIVANKDKLALTDLYGDPVKGGLPTTIKEFAQANEQRLPQIFQEYDALQKAAGQQGAQVLLQNTATELQKIANDPVVQDVRPDIASYAKSRSDTFLARGAYGTEQAQNAIKIYNESLQAFYKNPSYETASKAAVDAMIVNNLRTGLDSAIESTTEPGYQALKNKYGAYKSIEKDVIHRAIVDARKNAKGLLDFTDIASGAEVIKSIISKSPADFVAGAAMKGIKEYFKYVNNPNTAIKRMFRAAESTRSQTSLSPSSILPKK